MGLDTFAARTPQDEELGEKDSRAFAGIVLCGGMHSGSDGCFRGKVYDSLIEGVTGVSLYQEWITPEVVREMAAALEACDRSGRRSSSIARPWSASSSVASSRSVTSAVSG